MRFDFTHGRKPKYMVTVHGWNIEDHYYYANYKKALEMFKALRDNIIEGTSISLYDMKNDTRKEFAKA